MDVNKPLAHVIDQLETNQNTVVINVNYPARSSHNITEAKKQATKKSLLRLCLTVWETRKSRKMWR